jgi:hypothetical protein
MNVVARARRPRLVIPILPGVLQASSPGPATGSPPFVRIMIQGALVNASKAGGRCWDVGCDEATNSKAAEQAALAMKAAGVLTGGYAAAFQILAPLVVGAFSIPDTIGTAYVSSNTEVSEPQKLPASEDTLTPQWGLVWDHVPFNSSTFVQLDLWDSDSFSADDPMGRPVINSTHLAAALDAAKTYQVPVGDQTNNQVLYVGIHVVPDE